MARKTLHQKSEAELAAMQVRQVGNTCSFHAISVAWRMLLDYPIDPMALSEEVNRLWRRGRMMRVFPNWAVTPRMQVRILRYLAKTRGLPIKANNQHGNVGALPLLLSDPNVIPLITLLWLCGKAPPIYLGDTIKNFNASSKMGGHTMILAAYDPDHLSGEQLSTSWGFINPWAANTDQLFWMTADDFQRAWRFPLPLIGPNPLVLIRRTA